MREEMPEKDKNKVFCQNHHKQLPVTFITYSDFEALTTKVKGPSSTPQRAIPRERNTMRFAAIATLVRCDGQTGPPVEYYGPNAAEHFLESLQKEESKVKSVLADPKAMMMTREDWLASAQLKHATFVTILSMVTLFATTATSRENIEEQPITPAASSYG